MATLGERAMVKKTKTTKMIPQGVAQAVANSTSKSQIFISFRE
jgi:hypothetical protein